MSYKLTFFALCSLFGACQQTAPRQQKPIENNSFPIVVQPRHVDSLWVNDGFAWRNYQGYMQINLSENLVIYAANPLRIDSSAIYQITNFELQLNNKFIFSYPKDSEKKYILQAVSVEQDNLKAFFSPLNQTDTPAESLDRESWRLIFNEAFATK